MATSSFSESPDIGRVGTEMYRLAGELYPICRSITGDGVRRSLEIVGRHIPLEVHEVKSGTRVFDWTVPREWNIRDAWIEGPDGRRVTALSDHNLCVVNYSVPVRERMSLSELRPRIHSLPERPDWIPYRTSYYKETWGFCLSHNRLAGLAEGDYEVCIDSTLEEGSLTYGECYLPGDVEDEILLSCHVCHPSLANDNLSGISLLTSLAAHIENLPRRHSFRFLFIPGTIGSITWLARNQDKLDLIKHGIVAACVGDSGSMTYKRSRRSDAEIDRAVCHVLAQSGRPHEIVEFSPYGYDERQYCSPGINLAVGSLTRTPHGRYPEYHTSADDLDFIRPESLGESFDTYLAVLNVLENNRTYRSLNPKCEPQLGTRGLYRAMGGLADAGDTELAMLWVLNLADGDHSLLDMAERSGLAFDEIHRVAQLLVEHDLLEEASVGG